MGYILLCVVGYILLLTANVYAVGDDASCSTNAECESGCCLGSAGLKDGHAGTCESKGTNVWDECQAPTNTLFCDCQGQDLVCVNNALGDPQFAEEDANGGDTGTCQQACNTNADCTATSSKKCCVGFTGRGAPGRPLGFCRLRCRAGGNCMSDEPW